MLKYSVVIDIISLLIFESVRCQSPPSSPCPDVFRYESDADGWHGVVVARNPPPPGSDVVLRVTLTSPSMMRGGRLEIPRPIFQEHIEKNEPLEYRMIFPDNTQSPIVTRIIFNNRTICSGNSPYIHSLTLSSRIRSNSNNPYIRPVYNNINYRPTGNRYGDTTLAPSIGSECGLSTRNGLTPLLYGGTETKRGDWPWVVAMFIKKTKNLDLNGLCINFICSGSLISRNKVLTAAHCMFDGFQRRPKEELLLKFGGHNLKDWTEDTQSRDVKSFVIEENYDLSAIQNDIAILTTTREVDFNPYIRPVCLWTSSNNRDFLKESSIVVGWGLNENDDLLLNQQKEVDMKIVSNVKCKASDVAYHSFTSDTTLCAAGSDGSGPCQGDSGGGLYVQVQNRWYVRGIVSKALEGKGGRKCDLDLYAIFTDVDKYKVWINNNR